MNANSPKAIFGSGAVLACASIYYHWPFWLWAMMILISVIVIVTWEEFVHDLEKTERKRAHPDDEV